MYLNTPSRQFTPKAALTSDEFLVMDVPLHYIRVIKLQMYLR